MQLWRVASTTCTKHDKFCNKPKEVLKLFTCHKNFNISMTCGAVTSCNKISISCYNKGLNSDELQQNDKTLTWCNVQQIVIMSCDF